VQGAADHVTGMLEIAKERFPLKHAFAVMEEDPFSHGEKENLVVLLSDLPVPDEMRKASNDWRIWVADQAGAGSIHGLIVTIDPETRVWDGGNVVTRHGFMFYTESVYGSEQRNLHFEPSGPISAHAAGKLSMKEPMHGMSDDDGPWRVEAEFSAAAVRRPAVTGVLAGAEARNSPQYKGFWRRAARRTLRRSAPPFTRRHATP
jgi:hypothetical protein